MNSAGIRHSRDRIENSIYVDRVYDGERLNYRSYYRAYRADRALNGLFAGILRARGSVLPNCRSADVAIERPSVRPFVHPSVAMSRVNVRAPRNR